MSTPNCALKKSSLVIALKQRLLVLTLRRATLEGEPVPAMALYSNSVQELAVSCCCLTFTDLGPLLARWYSMIAASVTAHWKNTWGPFFSDKSIKETNTTLISFQQGKPAPRVLSGKFLCRRTTLSHSLARFFYAMKPNFLFMLFSEREVMWHLI